MILNNIQAGILRLLGAKKIFSKTPRLASDFIIGSRVSTAVTVATLEPHTNGSLQCGKKVLMKGRQPVSSQVEC
jgi:hypothetical protein